MADLQSPPSSSQGGSQVRTRTRRFRPRRGGRFRREWILRVPTFSAAPGTPRVRHVGRPTALPNGDEGGERPTATHAGRPPRLGRECLHPTLRIPRSDAVWPHPPAAALPHTPREPCLRARIPPQGRHLRRILPPSTPTERRCEARPHHAALRRGTSARGRATRLHHGVDELSTLILRSIRNYRRRHERPPLPTSRARAPPIRPRRGRR
jgi:hypothetical protein